MRRIFIYLLLMLPVLSVFADELPGKQFVHPERVRYNGDCMQIEGEDVFIYSAAFHYFRVPEALWRDRFAKIKEAGFNTVETYVPWNWHERNMPKGVNDFSQCNFDDLKEWLRMAHEEFGMYTIVRPGPFICAEWAGGAHPRWLGKFCPEKYETSFWLRSNHPDYLKWSRHWYDAVTPVFAAEQITRKKKGEKGIIMVQLENEYVYFGMSSDRKEEVLRCFSKACTDNGIDVPLFTCVTPEVRGSKDAVISQLFDMDNQYVWGNVHEAKQRIEDLKRVQPNAPAFVCELQGGWFSTNEGGLSEDSYLDGKHARGMCLMAMAGGATGLNFYMFFGGTHFAGWGARRMTTSYDYGAPLKESGGVGEKYEAVKGVGAMIERFGKELATSEPVAYTANVPAEKVTTALRRSADGTLFAFFLNRDKNRACGENVEFTLNTGQKINVYCALDARDSKVLVLKPGQTHGEWWPQTQAMPQRPTALPTPIRVLTAEKRAEQFDGEWKRLKAGASLPELGVNDCRYSMYRSTVTLTEKEAQNLGTLICEMFTGDPMYVQVNGTVVNRASADELDNTFVTDGLLRKGNNEIVAVYENRGHSHGYRPMEELSGMKRAGLGKRQSVILPMEKWEVRKVQPNERNVKELLNTKEGWEYIELDQSTIANLATLQIAGLEKPKWPAAWVLQGTHGKAIYKTTVDVTQEMLDAGCTVFEFGCVDDKGTLWVNGKEVASHDAWDKPFVVNAGQHLRKGANDVAIVVENNSGAGGILKPVRLYCEAKVLKPLAWEVSADLGGVVQSIHAGGGQNARWEKVKLKGDGEVYRKGRYAPKGERDGLLTWYKVTFDMPAQDAGVWTPWRVLVNASGTGYMWLNGENIGRYWEDGPQREFYMPECWLKFGETNTLVLGLRQSEKNGAVLEGVEIAPYYGDAEMR
ncbi:MAG: beta-galactosidase [Marinifilaceae bacterium]